MKKLVDAVTKGDLEEVKKLLNTHYLLGGYKDSKAINTELNDNNENAFYIACCMGNVKIAELLLEANAIIDEPAPGGETPFMGAAINNRKEILALLVEFGEDVNQSREFDGTTPLMLASYFGATDSINFLLDNGALIDKRRRDGCTALHVAVMNNQFESAKILLERGANMYTEKKDKENACSLALKSTPEINKLFKMYQGEAYTRCLKISTKIDKLYHEISKLNKKKQKYIMALEEKKNPFIFSPSAPREFANAGSQLAKPTPPENPDFNCPADKGYCSGASSIENDNCLNRVDLT